MNGSVPRTSRYRKAMNAPFGGTKSSSTQTYKEQAGDATMQFYTVDKTVYVSP